MTLAGGSRLTVAWEEEGLSRAAITPGVTTADDVHWWWRDRAKDLGLEAPESLQRAYRDAYEIGYAMQPPADRKPEVGVYCHSVGTSVHDIGARTSENNPHAFGDRVGYPLARDNWYSVGPVSARRVMSYPPKRPAQWLPHARFVRHLNRP